MTRKNGQGGRRSALTPVVAVLAAIACASAAATAAGDRPPAQAKRAITLPAGAGDRVLAARAAADRRRTAATTRTRRSGLERRRRAVSRRAYAGLGRTGALRVARRQRRGPLGDPVWRAVPLARGERVERFLGDHWAVVDAAGGGRNSLVSSTFPLRTTDAAGAMRPVDLTLVEGAVAMAPANPLVPVTLHRDLRRGARLDDVGVTVTPTGLGAPAAGQRARGRAFYANAQRDTDWVVEPLPEGLQTFALLRSAASPQSFGLRVDGAAGAELRPGRGPISGGYELAVGDDALVRIAPPRAWDADGRAVPVATRVEGRELRMAVDHRGRDLKYPVTLDPPVVEDFRHWRDNAALDFTGWRFVTNDAAKYKSTAGTAYIGRGLYVYTRTSYNYTPADYGQWLFDARGHGDAYIFRAEFHRLHHDNYHAPTSLFTGIYDPTRVMPNGQPAWQGNSPTSTSANFYDSVNNLRPNVNCVEWPACGERGTRGNIAVFGNRPDNEGLRSNFTDFMGGAAIFQSDDVLPRVSSDTVPDTWVRDAPSGLSATLTDTGLGMTRATVSLNPRRAWTHTTGLPASEEKSASAGCTDETVNGKSGTRTNPCQRDLGISWETPDLPEGVNRFDVRGDDVVGDTATIPLLLRVDRTPPTGSLVDVPIGVNALATIQGVMQDSLSGPGRWDLEYRVPSGTTWSPACSDEQADADGRYRCVWDTRSRHEGTHSLRALMNDRTDPNYGGPNTAYTSTVPIKVDRTPPTTPRNLQFLTPEEGSGQAAWDASSDPNLPDGTSGSGVARYAVRSRVAGGAWARAHDVGGTLSEDDFDHKAGTTLEFEVVAVDRAGNASAPAYVSGQVFGTPPDVEAHPLSEREADVVRDDVVDVDTRMYDAGVGMRRSWVAFDSGGREQGKEAPCTARSRPDGRPYAALCPATVNPAFTLDARRFGEGTHVMTLGAADRAGNETLEAYDVVVDRTAPSPPAEVELYGFEPLEGTVGLVWDEGDDPNLADGTSGSQTSYSQFRTQRGGAWSEWQRQDDDATVLTDTFVGEPITVEVRSVDYAGNISGVTQRSFVVSPRLPDAPTTTSSGGETVATRALGPNCTVRRLPRFTKRGRRMTATFTAGCTGQNFAIVQVRILRVDPTIFDPDKELREDKVDGPRRGIYTVSASANCERGHEKYKATFLLTSPAPNGRSEDFSREIKRTWSCGAEDDPDEHPCLTGGYHAYTRAEFRYNVCVRTRIYFERHVAQAHHMLPVAFEARFRRAGVQNIHDPVWGVWWRIPEHTRQARRYNRQWDAFFDQPRSYQAIVDFACARADEYHLDAAFCG